jgi:hypothetical protein
MKLSRLDEGVTDDGYDRRHKRGFIRNPVYDRRIRRLRRTILLLSFKAWLAVVPSITCFG